MKPGRFFGYAVIGLPFQLTCSRYFGTEITHNVVAPIDIEWTGPAQFNVNISAALRWEVRLTESSSTRLMNTAERLGPDASGQRKFMLKATGAAARLNDFSVPQRGLFAVAGAFVQTPRRISSMLTIPAGLKLEDIEAGDIKELS